MVRTPVFGIFNPILYIIMISFIDTLFLHKKIGLSLSHLVPEILGPKVGQLFHQNVTDFKHFVSIFSLIFYPTDTLFH